jgi:putative membrane protein
MRKKINVNRALLIVGALILVLGATLYLTVPRDVKELAQTHRERMLSGEWGPGRGFVDPGQSDGPSRRAWGHRGFAGGFRGFGMGGGIGLIALIVIVALAVGFAVRRSGGRGRSGEGRDAVEILREKFAAGEINKDEFAARRRVLENDGENE